MLSPGGGFVIQQTEKSQFEGHAQSWSKS